MFDNWLLDSLSTCTFLFLHYGPLGGKWVSFGGFSNITFGWGVATWAQLPHLEKAMPVWEPHVCHLAWWKCFLWDDDIEGGGDVWAIFIEFPIRQTHVTIINYSDWVPSFKLVGFPTMLIARYTREKTLFVY